MDGPDGKELLDRQSFVDTATNQRINVSVIRGAPASAVLDPTQYATSERAVNGSVTRVADTPLKERQIGWIVDPTTVAFVTGFNVTDDALFSFADGVKVAT